MQEQGGAPSGETSAPPVPASSWWVRGIARAPFGVIYALSNALAFLAHRVFPYRKHVVDAQLAQSFPDLDSAARASIAGRYYRNFADVFLETAKIPSLSEADVRERVQVENVEIVREALAKGRPVVLVAAHQCNWEWMLLALAVHLRVPVDAAYKPLKDAWAEREMLALRTRFGCRLVPADDILADIIKRRKVVRAIALLADQEPKTSEMVHWTTFLNRDTAFFVGGEEIARSTRYEAFFVGMRRVGRGRYLMRFEPMSRSDERLGPREFTERYVRLVEAQIRSSPPDWPWSHKRWKLKRPS